MDSARVLQIIKNYIEENVLEEKKFQCVMVLKAFKDIESKRDRYTTFDEFSADIDILVEDTRVGKCLRLFHTHLMKIAILDLCHMLRRTAIV